ncbi:MAG: ATP-binding protein [Solirubrobacterales bacterium]
MSSTQPEATIEFSLPARAENVPLVRHALAGLAESLGMDPSDIADLKTVVTEACMNVVIHAYEREGPVEVSAWPDGASLIVRVRDFGRGIRPLADVDRRSLRLGLPLIAALTTDFEVKGGPDRGTQVTMRMPISPDATAAEPVAAPADTVDEARIAIPAGELLAPILSRVISMYAARADFSVDKLSDAVLLSDAISAHGPEGFPNGTARLAISEEDEAFSIRVGPLEQGGGRRLVEGMRIPMLDASLEDLADEVRVDAGEAGEHLVVRLAQQASVAE